MIKSTLITVLLLMTCLIMQAQNFNAVYEYDANGNRTRVTIIYLSIKSATSDVDQIIPQGNDTANLPRKGWAPGIADSLTDYRINIYPNPTHGKLLIEINSAAPEKIAASGNVIKVWNMQGQLLLNITRISSYNLMDFSGYASGTYVLKIYLNGQVKDYKIVKD